MSKLRARDKFSKFKRGMTQVNFVLNIFNLALTAFTAMIVGFAGLVPTWLVIAIEIPLVLVGVWIIWNIGKWDYDPNKKRTILRKDIQVDPLSQTTISMNVEIMRKLGIPESMWYEWMSEETKQKLGVRD